MRKITALALIALLCLTAIPSFAQTETPIPVEPTRTPESTAEASKQNNTAIANMNPLNLVGSDSVTFVRFANAAIDIPALDIYVQKLGDTAVVKDLSFGHVTNFVLLPGGKYNVVARAAGSGITGKVITTMNWNFQRDTSWLVTLIGLTSSVSLQLEPINLLRNDIAGNRSRVRVVNFVASAPALTVNSSTGDDFGHSLGWIGVFDADMKPGTYSLTVKSKDGSVLLTDSAVDLGGGTLSTLLLVGSMNGIQPLRLVTFNSPASVSRVQFINNSGTAIQIFARHDKAELIKSLAVGQTSEWVTVPSGSVTFVSYVSGTGPTGQEQGAWIGVVQPLRDTTITFTATKTADTSTPVFSPALSDINTQG